MDTLTAPGEINLVLLFCGIRNGHYGLGSHIYQMLGWLKAQPGIRLCIVKTDVEDLPEIQSGKVDGIETIAIPSPEHKVMLDCSDTAFQRMYAQRLADIIELYLGERENLLFWVNSADYLHLATVLKQRLENCKVLSVQHAWSWKCRWNIADEAFANHWRLKDNSHPEAFLHMQLQQALVELADLTVTVTRQASNFYLNATDIPAEKFCVINNGMTKPQLSGFSREKLRRKYGYTNGEKILLFSGRIRDEKGLSYALRAFTRIADRHPELRLILTGDGEFHKFIPLAASWFSRVAYTGQLNREQMQELYEIADIGILPSLYEQCSYSAIEMRFNRVPLIVSSVDGLDEMFTHEKDALKLSVLYDTDGQRILDIEQIGESISRLVNDTALCRALADASFEKAAREFTADIMYEKYFNAIHSLFQIDAMGSLECLPT